MRYLPRALLAGVLGFALALLAGCASSGGLLSADQASTLNNQLNVLSSALAARQCDQAAQAATTLTNSAASLGGIDPTLSSAVTQGANQVASDASAACPATTASSPSSSTSTTTTTTTSTSTPTSTSTSSSTTPSTSSSTSTTSSTSATSSSTTGTSSTGGGTGGVGLGNGNGSGNDGGNGPGATGQSGDVGSGLRQGG